MTESMTPIVQAEWLAQHLHDEDVRVVDVRWVLGKPGAGRAAFDASRIPGALYLDLDTDLADHPAVPDPRRGRHPLPDPATLSSTLAAAGIGQGTRVIAYDDAGGTQAARLWWLLDWLGLPSGILDGGFTAWRAAGLPVEEGAPRRPSPAARPLPASAASMAGVAGFEEVKALVAARLAAPDGGDRVPLLLDARPGERFRGEVEPIDPRPGHIPTARSAPTGGNLDARGRFLSPEALRARFAALGVTDGRDVICLCGSGVTACHNLLALHIAGLPGARLYPGSYSEWSNDPDLPVALGEG